MVELGPIRKWIRLIRLTSNGPVNEEFRILFIRSLGPCMSPTGIRASFAGINTGRPGKIPYEALSEQAFHL